MCCSSITQFIYYILNDCKKVVKAILDNSMAGVTEEAADDSVTEKKSQKLNIILGKKNLSSTPHHLT